MYKGIVSISLLLSINIINAQNSVDEVLESIRINNKSIAASKQYIEAKGLEYNTGRTLANPKFVGEYLFGNSAAAGDQLELAAFQEFDFPSVYSSKKKLANEQVDLIEIKGLELEKDIMLRAKSYCIELIYLNQKESLVGNRVKRSSSILDDYKKRFQLDEISALDLNKAKIQLLGFQADLREIKNEQKFVLGKLMEMNGGKEVYLGDTLYPVYTDITSFEEIHDSVEANDPSLKWIAQINKVYESQLKVAKAEVWPSFELGYKYQKFINQQFNGVMFGMSIPMFQQKNKIKTQKANVELGRYQIEEHKIEHFHHIKHLYLQYEHLKASIQEYKEVLEIANSEMILQQSLELGQIDFITYARELEFYYDAKDELLALEKEIQLVIAELHKYQL